MCSTRTTIEGGERDAGALDAEQHEVLVAGAAQDDVRVVPLELAPAERGERAGD